MVAVPDVSGWEEKFWFSTGGTRAKKYLEKPGGGLYYFKRSAEKPATETKPGKYFRYEFWSEIIAYQLGTLIGFKVLEYVPAIDGDRVGCLCADMVKSDKEALIGGIQYLQGALPSFDPGRNDARNQYTFQLIEQALAKYELLSFMPQIIEMIVFDALIGNSDRHQENWAIISDFTSLTKLAHRAEQLAKIAQDLSLPPWARSIIKGTVRMMPSKILSPEVQQERLTAGKKRFSLLFDNGSSLGRELEETRVTALLQNEAALKKYIERGDSAIHWDGKRVSHFNLLGRLLLTEHGEKVRAIVDRAQNLFVRLKVEDILMSVDSMLPMTHDAYRLPFERKKLILKMITSRLENLQRICHARI